MRINSRCLRALDTLVNSSHYYWWSHCLWACSPEIYLLIPIFVSGEHDGLLRRSRVSPGEDWLGNVAEIERHAVDHL